MKVTFRTTLSSPDATYAAGLVTDIGEDLALRLYKLGAIVPNDPKDAAKLDALIAAEPLEQPEPAGAGAPATPARTARRGG